MNLSGNNSIPFYIFLLKIFDEYSKVTGETHEKMVGDRALQNLNNLQRIILLIC